MGPGWEAVVSMVEGSGSGSGTAGVYHAQGEREDGPCQRGPGGR